MSKLDDLIKPHKISYIDLMARRHAIELLTWIRDNSNVLLPRLRSLEADVRGNNDGLPDNKLLLGAAYAAFLAFRDYNERQARTMDFAVSVVDACPELTFAEIVTQLANAAKKHAAENAGGEVF